MEILTAPLTQKEDQAFEELLGFAVDLWVQQEAVRGANTQGQLHWKWGEYSQQWLGTEQPEGVRMDKPMGANHMCLCLSVRGCEGEGLCLCAGGQSVPGFLQTGPVCCVLPSPGTAFPPAQSRRPHLPSIQSLQLLESILAGHTYHLNSCTSAFCVAVVWFGFSPCPYSVFECISRESSSNISAPQGSRVTVMWECLRKAENWQVSSNLCFSELTVRESLEFILPCTHVCQRNQAKNSMLQVWCCLVTSEPAHQLGQVRVAALRQSR